METPIKPDRRHFLLGSAAAGALMATGCAGWSPASSTPQERPRTLYDSIFEAMLQARPEMATGLGLDTGARASLKSRLSDASPAGKMSLYRPMIDALPQLQRIDRAELQARERAWLDTALWLSGRAAEAATFPFGGIGVYNYPVPYTVSQLTGSYQ